MEVPFRSGRCAAPRVCVQGAVRVSASERKAERTFHSAPHVLPGRAVTHGPWEPQVMTESEDEVR
jgi:hypothetical protein